MEQIDQRVDKNSIIREFARDTISLEELYQKFQEKEVDHKIYVVKEDQFAETEVFELVGILGSGRSCYVFLALVDKKLVSLRMSYEEGDFENKFDSVRVEMEEDYDKYFLNILYPAVPVGYLCLGSVKKKQKLFFDKKVFASFWEKADATLTMKLGASIENKLKWFLECLKGLQLIHARKRAHFDIKLENLFLVDHRLKIGDFEYYLKIEEFIRSKIHFCGTPGHIAPEMFYEKKITERIDIFSAGAAFARLFTGVESKENPGLEVKLSAEEEREFNTLFKKKHLQRLTIKKVREAFINNFKRFNFYRSYLQKELQNPGLPEALRKIYPLLLNMMSLNPGTRPDANTLILQVEEITGKSTGKPEDADNGFTSPVFKISKTPITIVNLNKKSSIEIGSIKRKEQADHSRFNDINLRFVDISRRHLQVNYIESPTGSGEDKIEILDLHSKHGVFLNKEKIEPGNPRELNPGDIIQLGSIISFRFTRDQGFYLLKNITRERRKGNLMWMDRDQVKELPDQETVIILLKKPLYLALSSFGADEETALMVDERGDLEIKGGPENALVNGDIIL
ncbi:MAG: FHA domain-containing protein [Candidatus Aminicenantes bacterium]|nr:MAG: FHA domain-containing protein [Candidatus Aminicenantes bacterium]